MGVLLSKKHLCSIAPCPIVTYFNPLPTNDAFRRRQILAACYQLAQSVLKIGSALAARVGQGEVGGSTALADSAWWQLQLPVEKPWSMTGGPFVCFLAEMGIEKRLHFWQFRQRLVQRSVLFGRRVLTIECSLMSGCVQGRELTENVS